MSTGVGHPGTLARLTVVALTGLLVLVADQASKAAVRLSVPPLREGDAWSLIVHVENTTMPAAPLGLGAPESAVAGAVVSLGIWSAVALAYLLQRGPLPVAYALGVALGGSLGNNIDRLERGAVFDFIYVPFGPDGQFGQAGVVLNLADIAVVLGMLVALLGIHGFIRERTPVAGSVVAGAGEGARPTGRVGEALTGQQ